MSVLARLYQAIPYPDDLLASLRQFNYRLAVRGHGELLALSRSCFTDDQEWKTALLCTVGADAFRTAVILLDDKRTP